MVEVRTRVRDKLASRIANHPRSVELAPRLRARLQEKPWWAANLVTSTKGAGTSCGMSPNRASEVRTD